MIPIKRQLQERNFQRYGQKKKIDDEAQVFPPENIY